MTHRDGTGYWRYRVVAVEELGAHRLDVMEVYYGPGDEMTGLAPATASGTTLPELKLVLSRMLKALEEPVVDLDNPEWPLRTSRGPGQHMKFCRPRLRAFKKAEDDGS